MSHQPPKDLLNEIPKGAELEKVTTHNAADDNLARAFHNQLMASFTFKKCSDEILSTLKDKNVLIVGGTAGIGKALAISCLKRDAKVTIVGRRDPDASLAKAHFVKKDLSLMREACTLRKDVDFDTFDNVVFTVGIVVPGSQRRETAEKIEADIAVSFLSRFAIAKQFGDFSKRSDLSRKPRIFVMGNPGYHFAAQLDDFNWEKEYKRWPAHMNGVVANEALVSYLHNDKVNVYGLFPGLIMTEMVGDFWGGKDGWLAKIMTRAIGWVTPTVEEYVENVLIDLLVTPDIENLPKTNFNRKGGDNGKNPWLLIDDNQSKIMRAAEQLLDRALKSQN